MTETPREYKKRIDEQREKRRINRDKLIQQIEDYELVDKNYKARIKQEILSNFEKNEKAEKNSELYVKIGEELLGLDAKYQELEELKEKLEEKKQGNSDLKKQLIEQDMDGADETTLKMQMLNLKKIKAKLETVEKEIEEMEKEIENREKELEEIEETYGKKNQDSLTEPSGTDSSPNSEGQDKTEGLIESEEKPRTLEEYKENVLKKRGKLDYTRREIIKLLDEGTGIDENLKKKIKGEISEVFYEYKDKQEGSLRMKSARYVEDRKWILNQMGFGQEGVSQLIGGKLLINEKKPDGKYRVMWGNDCLGEGFDEVFNIQELGGKPVFRVKKGGKYCIMRGYEVCVGRFDDMGNYEYAGGKPIFTAENHGKRYVIRGKEKIGFYSFETSIGGKSVYQIRKGKKWCIVRGDKLIGGWFDDVGTVKIIGGKPAFIAEKHGKYCLMRGNKQIGDWYDEVKFGEVKEFGGKPVIRVQKGSKYCYMQGTWQLGGWFDYVDEIKNMGGKPVFQAKKDDEWCVMRGNQQCGNVFDKIYAAEEVGGKPVFLATKNGHWCVMRGKDKIGDWYDKVEFDAILQAGGKPVFFGKIGRKICQMWGNEQCGDWFDTARQSADIGGKPFFKAKNRYKEYVMRGNQQLGDRYDSVYEHGEMGGRPVFQAEKDDKWCIMRGNEQMGDWYHHTDAPKEVGGKPAFAVEQDGKRCYMRGNEQIGDWSDSREKCRSELHDFIDKYNEKQQENTAETEDLSKNVERNKSENISEEPSQTLREKREKVVLERYQKKLNRDELLKIISGCEGMDEKVKKKLESDILRDFYDEFKKATSTPEYQGWDAEYRELKRIGREYDKKQSELAAKKEKFRPEMVELDKKLYDIVNSAMELENGSRWKNRKLNKTKIEWETLENRQNEILQEVRKLDNESKGLCSLLSSQQKKYGKKVERPIIEGKKLDQHAGIVEKLKSETTLKGYKEAYQQIMEDKQKYMDDLIEQIRGTDFGISEEKKQEVVEQLKISMSNEIQESRQGDELIKMADEIEKWLGRNRKTAMQKINELKGKITEKESEISELKSKGKGDSTDEIFQIKEKEFELRNELLSLKNEYESIKMGLDEKLVKYDGEIIDWTKDLVVETWKGRIKRIQQEERESKRKEQEKMDKDKANEMLQSYRRVWDRELSVSSSVEKEIIKAAEKIPVSINIEPDGSRLIEINLGGKKYKILDVNLKEESDMSGFGSYRYNGEDRTGVRLPGVKGESSNERSNKKLKEYIKQQKTRGFDIPSKELQQQILSELKECCEYNFDLSEQLLLWMYLTGLHGCYLLKEGDFVMFGLSAYRFSTQGDGDGKASIYLISSE